MSLNGSHSDETEVKLGSTVSLANQALELEEMEKCDVMSGLEEKDRLIIPSDDQIEKSFRVNQDGSMTVEMKVRLTIKQEEMIHWTTTVSRASASSQELSAFSQPVSNYYSPDNNDDNNNRTRQSNVHSYESKNKNTQTIQNHCGSSTSEALEKPKPCFRRLPTPGPRRVRRKETSLENTKRQAQTEVQGSTVGTYPYEHTDEGKLLERYCLVSHSSSSGIRPVPKPRKKNLREAKRSKTPVSGMAEVLQLYNNGKEITETVLRIHQSQDTCENYLAKTWADEDDRFEFKKPDSTETGLQSSSNDSDTNLTKASESCASENIRNNEVLSLLSGQSDLSQTINDNASSFTEYEDQPGCESSHRETEMATKELLDGKSKSAVSKMTKMSQNSKWSHKRVFLKGTVTVKKQQGSVPDFIKDLKNSDALESQSFTGSDTYGLNVKKRKKGQSPEKKKACHSNMLKDERQNINSGHADLLNPHMKEILDIIPSSHSAPFKNLTKPRSENGGTTQFPKESKELSESASMPVLHSSPCNVHQYVENWLEKIHPESVPYMDELNPYEPVVRFQIESDFSDISEMKSELDKDSLVENCATVEGSTFEKPVSQRLLQIRCEGGHVEIQNLKRSCKSMPSVKMHADEKQIGRRKNKSSEVLVLKLPDAVGETSPNTQLNPKSSMKDILEQLYLAVQLISRACSHSHLSSLEKNKSSSTPDFSSLLSSVFGSPCKALLSFLTVMTLRDGIAYSATEDSGSANANTCSNPEALQVMQSIQKLASIEDEEELKASLASVHISTSEHLKKSWKDFQEKNNIKASPPQSPRQSEQEFVLEVNSEEDGQDEGHIFGIREVMDELNMCDSVRREISSIFCNELTDFIKVKPAKEDSGHENEITNIEKADASRKDNLHGSLKEKGRCLEERESQYDDMTNASHVDISKESEALHLLQSSSHTSALPIKESVIEEMVKNVQIEDIMKQGGLVAFDIVDDIKTNQEMYVDNQPRRADLCEEKHEMMDNVQMINEKYTEDKISQAEFHVADYSQTSLEDNMEWQKTVGCMQIESELRSHVSKIEAKDGRSNSEAIDYIVSKGGDCTEGCGIISEEEDAYCETRVHPEQPDRISVASEIETVKAQIPNYGTIQADKNNALHKDATEASDLSVDEFDPYSNDNFSKEAERNNDPEETICSSPECENPAADFSMSDQENEHSDHYKSASCTWQESECEHDLQKPEKERVTETQAHNANENDEAADKDEDSDAEPISPQELHQEGEYSDCLESFKGQEVAAEPELQSLEEERVGKNPTPPDEHDSEQSIALDTDRNLDAESHHCYQDDPSIKDVLRGQSCKRKEIHKAQSEASAVVKETEMDHECHCVRPTLIPQQLLDFVNLALMSSALNFTYDCSGCLRLEPDRCKNRVMSLSKNSVNNRCLPSPNTSDLSDYRPDTSDSGRDLVSTDLLTESGEDEAEKLSNFLDDIKQSSANINRKVTTLANGLKKPYPETKQIAGSSVKRIDSLGSFPDSMGNSTLQDQSYCNSSDSIGNSEHAQCLALHAETDSGEGILIDKGRWLLKENHLIRKSPPVPMGMYGNMDTTSVDTGQENTSEDASYGPCGRKRSPLAVVSSSELEDMAKPSTPKCTYFNMTHSSDSDPFLDNQSVTSNKGKGFTRKNKEVSPLGETSKMLVKKNGSLPSFASVEFKAAAGKVHPEVGMASSVVEKCPRSQSNMPHEEESGDGVSFRCGQHCPIL